MQNENVFKNQNFKTVTAELVWSPSEHRPCVICNHLLQTKRPEMTQTCFLTALEVRTLIRVSWAGIPLCWNPTVGRTVLPAEARGEDRFLASSSSGSCLCTLACAPFLLFPLPHLPLSPQPHSLHLSHKKTTFRAHPGSSRMFSKFCIPSAKSFWPHRVMVTGLGLGRGCLWQPFFC